MFRKNKKHTVTPQMVAEIHKATVQQNRAKTELEEVKTLAQHLKEIRDDNHFTRDFRIAIGLRK